MIYLFDYGDYGTGAQTTRSTATSAISSNPAKTAFLPAAALIFRAGDLARAPMCLTSY